MKQKSYSDKCFVCGKTPKVTFSGGEPVSYCLDCYNEMMALETGAESS